MSFHLLAGRWRGRGISDFPTIDRVEYVDELDIEWDAGRQVFCYEQRAVLADGSPSHRECGFIRILEDGHVEWWNAQKNGRTEVLTGSGSWNESSQELELDLRSTEFGNDPRMLASRRRLKVTAESLRYELSMVTTTTPEPDLLPHLRSGLTRLS